MLLVPAFFQNIRDMNKCNHACHVAYMLSLEVQNAVIRVKPELKILETCATYSRSRFSCEHIWATGCASLQHWTRRIKSFIFSSRKPRTQHRLLGNLLGDLQIQGNLLEPTCILIKWSLLNQFQDVARGEPPWLRGLTTWPAPAAALMEPIKGCCRILEAMPRSMLRSKSNHGHVSWAKLTKYVNYRQKYNLQKEIISCHGLSIVFYSIWWS